MGDPLTSYLSRFLKDPIAFEKALVHPFLVFEPKGWPPEDDNEETGEYRYRTVSAVERPVLLASETLVFAVKKQKDNAFQRGVTVGRTKNNDVVLDDASVSRFHAYLQQQEDGRWGVADAGSKNGTQILGKPLAAKKLTPLRPDARIKFGQVEVSFVLPEGLMRLLKSRER